MKRIIFVLAMLSAGVSNAAIVGEGMANETALSHDATYDYYVDSMVSRRIGATVSYTSATIASLTFTDGRQASGTITITGTQTLKGLAIKIKGISFIGGPAYVTGTYSSGYNSFFAISNTVTGCAENLTYAINNNPIIAPLITATSSVGVVTIKSDLADGVAYALTGVTGAAVSGATMTGAVTATVSGITDKIYSAAHGLSTGMQVLFSTAANGGLTGLTTQTTYYAIYTNANYFQLASTLVNALAGTAIDMTPTIGASSHTFTLAPLAISGTPSFKWRASNDGIYWVDIVTTSIQLVATSVTMSAYTADGVTAIWDFGAYAWRWLRLAVTGPTQGGILLKADLNVKQ